MEIAALALRWLGWRGALALAALLALGVQTLRLDHERMQAARAAAFADKAQLAAERAARAEEQARAEAVDRIAGAYEKGKADAQAAAERVAADLRAGNLQLRDRWQGCQARLSGAAIAAGEPDAAARDREESAGRIVRAAAECDAQVRGLQALIRAERN